MFQRFGVISLETPQRKCVDAEEATVAEVVAATEEKAE